MGVQQCVQCRAGDCILLYNVLFKLGDCVLEYNVLHRVDSCVLEYTVLHRAADLRWQLLPEKERIKYHVLAN